MVVYCSGMSPILRWIENFLPKLNEQEATKLLLYPDRNLWSSRSLSILRWKRCSRSVRKKNDEQTVKSMHKIFSLRAIALTRISAWNGLGPPLKPNHLNYRSKLETRRHEEGKKMDTVDKKIRVLIFSTRFLVGTDTNRDTENGGERAIVAVWWRLAGGNLSSGQFKGMLIPPKNTTGNVEEALAKCNHDWFPFFSVMRNALSWGRDDVNACVSLCVPMLETSWEKAR